MKLAEIAGRVESLTLHTGDGATTRVSVYADHQAIDFWLPTRIARDLRLGQDVQIVINAKAAQP